MTRDEYVRRAVERLRGIPATAGGHGHVRPRPDGAKARCGGPGLCADCARELAATGRSPVSADRPVFPAPDTVTDDMVRVAAEAIEDVAIARIGRDLGTLHRDEIVRAGLEAVVPLIRERVAAELGRTCQDTAPSVLVDDGHLHECEREAEHRSPKHRCACGCEWWLRTGGGEPTVTVPRSSTNTDWYRHAAERLPFITPAVPSSFATPVTYTATEDFHEPDEPVADVAAAFDVADKGVTRRPTSEARPEQVGGGDE